MTEEDESGRKGFWSIAVIAILALIGAILAIRRRSNSE